MSDVPNRRMRTHALAAVAATALSLLVVAPASAGRVDLGGLQSDTTFDRFIVKYKDGAPENSDATLRNRSLENATASLVAASSTQRASGLRQGALRLEHQRRLAVGGNVVRLNRRVDRVDAETLMRQIAADPNVEYVEIDQRMYPTLVPNDPRLSEQWAFGTTNAGINVRPAWDKSTGAGIVVAVIDTGIVPHPDLDANILPGYDFISDTFVSRDGDGRDSNPRDEGDWNPVANECYSGSPVSNSSWHGTHVAGTIVAVTNNAVGVAGTAFNAKVVPVRVLGRCGGYTSDIADGIIWASGGTVSGVPANANPAEVINLSLGGGGTCSATYQNAINGAVGRGTTVVVAAGNSNVNVSGSVPANCANVIAVAATTSAGSRASFSNFGAGIDISAPGQGILSTLNSGTTTPGSASYASYNGTSMAAPHVAGIVALMQAAAPSPLTPAQIESTLKSTARPLPGTCTGGCGAGIANADAAVTAVMGSGANVPPVANFSSSVSGLTVQFTDTSTDSDGSIASRSWNFGDGTTSTATNPSKTYASAGTYTVTLTVTDNGGASNTRTASVTVSSGGGGGSVLQNGVPVSGVSGAASSQQYWTITVPAGATNLNIAIAGGTGDADLYVRFGSQPTTSTYDCRPYRSGNAESCAFATPQAGTYHVMVRGYSAFSGVTLTGSFTAGSGGGSVLQNGVPVTGLSGAANNERRWTVEVPAGVSQLRVRMSGGTGDADLYVRQGAQPTTTTYTCRPYLSGNNETCTQNNPQAGTWHVMVRGYSAYSGVTLVAEY